MPVNFQEIQVQVRQMGERAPQREKLLAERRQRAAELMTAFNDKPDALRKRVELAAANNRGLRCALPCTETLAISHPCTPLAIPISLLAADGSQINPDRHAQVEFGVINVGVFIMRPGQSDRPGEVVHSRLLYHDDLVPADGPLTEDLVALMRDESERAALADLADTVPPPVVALTDGPLELFREPKQQAAFERLFGEYLQKLDRLCELHAVTAGYVDKPRADLVIRMLELILLPESDLSQAGRLRPLQGISDISLYRSLLAPGDRSTVFALQSSSAGHFPGQLALHFFYLNVGSENQPHLARVEIPAWVAQSEPALDLLQATLVSQCLPLGNLAYPYALHRAHEVAVVSFDEKKHLENLICVELINRGLQPGEPSNKQALKNQTGSKTRYKP